MRIALAYSGSLEGSAAIQWLREHHDAEVVAVTLDLGQGRALEAVRDRALALGALRAHVLDARESFARSFVLPALRADALHDGRVPMALALSRPLIAEKLVELAGIERASAVAHTGHATGGTSTLDVLLGSIAPGLPVLTPARDWALSTDALAAFAHAHGLGILLDEPRMEQNFWGRSVRTADGSAAVLPPATGESPAGEAAFVDITFVRGLPTALNGVPLPLIELVASLGILTATHGIGRGGAGHLWCEAPAAVLLHAAHRELTRAVSGDAELRACSAEATARYVRLVEDGRWFSPLREGLDAYFSSVQSRVNGHVRLRVFRGEHSTITTELSDATAQPALARTVPSSAQH